MFLHEQTLSDPTGADATMRVGTEPAPTMSYLDSFYSNFDVAAAMAEKRAAEDKFAEARAEKEAADAKMRDAAARASMAETAITGYVTWQETQNDEGKGANGAGTDISAVAIANEGGPAVITGAPGGSNSPTGRASVHALIDSGPDDATWTIPSLAEALDVGQEFHHAIGVSLQRLTRDGKIARVRKGVYTKLPSEPVAPGAEEGREMRLNGSQEGPG